MVVITFKTFTCMQISWLFLKCVYIFMVDFVYVLSDLIENFILNEPILILHFDHRLKYKYYTSKFSSRQNFNFGLNLNEDKSFSYSKIFH